MSRPVIATHIPLVSLPVASGRRFVLRTLGRWWAFNPTSSVNYYQLQLSMTRMYAVSWILGMPVNVTLREAGWHTLVEVHSGLLLTMDVAGDVVRLTSVQDERSVFKVVPLSGSNFQLYSAVGSAVGAPLGSRLRPVPYGNLSVVDATLTEGE
jgi:hypothetical protein